MTTSDARITRHLNYEPLAHPNHIRLLRRLERTRFQIECYDIQSSPEYDAVSYTWGPCMNTSDNNCTEEPFFIECDGVLCSVSENLFDFLNLIQQELLWVDALCINQQDNEEKAVQVGRMGEIYAHAHIVIMWLGKQTTDLAEFVFLHDKFLPEIDKNPDILKKDFWNLEFLSKFGIKSKEQWRQYWVAYWRFFRHRRFFERAWIGQEYALGALQVFFCNDTALHVNQMNRLWYYIMNSAWLKDIDQIDPTLKTHPLAIFTSLRGAIFEERAKKRGFHEVKGGPEGDVYREHFESVSGAVTSHLRAYCFLILLIDMTRSLAATDPRDKVYSVFGLVNLHWPKISNCHPIQPNYGLSFQKVYISITAEMVQLLPFLTILSYVEIDNNGQRDVDLPSWVPDFRLPLQSQPLVSYMYQPWQRSSDLESLSKLQKAPFNASRTNASDPAFRAVQDDIVFVHGACFDTIEVTSNPISLLYQADTIASVFHTYKDLDHVYKPTNEHRSETLWRTIVADSDRIGYPASTDIGDGFRDFVLWVWSRFLALDCDESQVDEMYHLKWLPEMLDDYTQPQFRSLPIYLPLRDQIFQQAQQLRQQHLGPRDEWEPTPPGKAREFIREFDRTQGGRLLYRTTRGYLGLGPISASRGDEVWLIRGALIPFVMRHHTADDNQTRLQLLGETYLHGFMHGEMLTDKFEANIAKVGIV